MVFLGDSISECGNWDEWFPGTPVLNRGIAGETSAQVLGRLDSAVRAPRAVFLSVGTNDLTGGIPQHRTVSNVAGILAGIERRASGTPVVVQSVMPRALKFRDEVCSLNDRVRDVVTGAAEQVRYLDLWPVLATPEGRIRPELTRDGVHPNGRGYRVWVDALTPVIQELTAAPSTPVQ